MTKLAQRLKAEINISNECASLIEYIKFSRKGLPQAIGISRRFMINFFNLSEDEKYKMLYSTNISIHKESITSTEIGYNIEQKILEAQECIDAWFIHK